MRGSALFIGNFLSSTRKHRHYCEDLTERLEARNWAITRTSSQPERLRKLADMMHVVWSKRREYEIAHVDLFSGPAFAWAEVVCFELASLRKPFVITLHGGGLPAFARRWPRRTRRLLASAAAVTSPTQYLRAELADFAPILVIPNGIDLSRYALAPHERGARRLIWLRAFHEVYNPVLAVDVLARALARDPATTLQMIGPDRGDGTLERVRARADKLGVARALELVGPVANDEVPRYLAAADVFLNTSNTDNAPVSVLEALACELCVVSTSVGGIPYLLSDGTDALLVPPDDPDAMAKAIARLSEEPALRHRLAKHGRMLAASSDWSNVIARWDELLRMIDRA